MFDFSIVTQWVHSLLTSFMPEELAVLIECIVIGVCIMLAYAVIAIIMIFMERKVCAAFQCRLGPMRVGPQGTIQVSADVFKMLIKEIITIRQVPVQFGTLHCYPRLYHGFQLPTHQQGHGGP